MSSILSTWEPDRLIELLLDCARIALDGWPAHAYRLKNDGTLVTQKDEAIEALLATVFDAPDKGVHMIGEETCASKSEDSLRAALEQTAWIVDPIDGTAPYAHGLSYWGTSIGLARHGVLEHGAIILPVTGEIYLTDGEQVRWSRHVDMGAPAGAVNLTVLEPSPAPWTPGGMIALGQRFTKQEILPWPNPVASTGCAINVLAYLMQGHLSAYIGHMKLWDLAGVLPMLRRTGIAGVLLDGTPIDTPIDAAVYHMSPGHVERWAMRDSCLFAPETSIGTIRDHLRHLHDEPTPEENRQ